VDLREFVRESLCQIIRGIEDAQRDLKSSQARIAPIHVRDSAGPGTYEATDKGYYRAHVSEAEFDVAVTVSEETAKGGGLKIAGGIFGAGAKAESERCNQTVSRIRFSVPLVLPPPDEK
jgi:hypothetical protein